ncbi:MAG: RluA family pseudouridine synthase [Oscillospiraceae bacterium]|nr:RluA family pseudouridine synthase [Oscillospiraceae bacterium]
MEILYKDRHVAVCVKPVGVISEDAGMPALLREQLGGEAFCVHRLDTVVGGVMVYALNKKAAAKLSAYIAGDMLTKEYLAVVEGIPNPDEGYMDDLLLKDSAKGKSYVVQRMRKGVKDARLQFKVLQSVATVNGTYSLVWVRLVTGRFHQIRVQFASRKHPLVGDGKYGSKCNRCTPALWAWRLTFPHPQTGEWRRYDQKPPEQFPWNLFDENKETEQN